MLAVKENVGKSQAFTAEGALARTALLADHSLVFKMKHSQIQPALDNALVLLRVSAWRHP